MRIVGLPVLVLALVVACLWAGGAARAQSCTASTMPAAFGIYQPLAGTAATTTGTVTVTCQAAVSLLVSYTMALSVGGGTSFAARSMGGMSPRLGYQLYRDSAFSQVWGDGTGGTFTVTDGYLLSILVPVTRSYTAYGRIPASEPASVGTYTDAVMVTLTY